MNEINKIYRYGEPSKMDMAKQGTECWVLNKTTYEYDVYQQVSTNEESPIWEFIGTKKE